MTKRFRTLNNLDDIPKLKYEGYIWKSDQSKPIVIKNELYDFSSLEETPFIIEGYLYCKDEKIAISIKQIDGEYYISKIDLNEIGNENIIKYRYLCDPAVSNQVAAFKYIEFIEFWQDKEDKLCEDMEVLQPTWIAFTGFSKEEL